MLFCMIYVAAAYEVCSLNGGLLCNLFAR
jgi:hypothetical protein